MSHKKRVVFVAGPTASGKSAKAIELAQELNGEVISVDSRQVYRGLNIGTEKITPEEMQGIPHHLINIRDPHENYSAGDFVHDAQELILRLHEQDKTPILAGGTHFYFDALLHGLPQIPLDAEYRIELEKRSTESLADEIRKRDPVRFEQLDVRNRRRLLRALEIIRARGQVPLRTASRLPYEVEWIVLNPSKEELRTRIDTRLKETLSKGLVEEVRNVRERVGDTRLNEFGLEYRVIGEYLRGEREEESLFPALSSKLWHYARRQKAWLRKLQLVVISN